MPTSRESSGERRSTDEILRRIGDTVVGLDRAACELWCRRALDEGIEVIEGVTGGLSPGMDRVRDLYARKEYFVPEMLLASDAFSAGLDVFKPHIRSERGDGRSVTDAERSVIIGVVEGDIHDIGKNIVKTMFEANGWEVADLGRDVKAGRFLEEQARTGAKLVALSALMTTSMMKIPGIVASLKAQDPQVLIMVGGAPLTPTTAARFGADGYGADAIAAVREAERLVASAG